MTALQGPAPCPATRRSLAALGLALAIGLTLGVVQSMAAGLSWPFGLGRVEHTGPALYRARCGGCHALDRNKYGPAHDGVFGRTAGGRADYRYTDALKRSGLVWTEATLDAWLADPRRMVPGTRMDARVTDPDERRLIIDYLRSQLSLIHI